MGSNESHHTMEIGVVGGGASAVCLLDALAETDAAPGGVTVFEAAAHLWRGRPYQSDLPTVRVNIPPDGMSVRFGDKGHFRRWLIERDLAFGSEADFEDPFSGMRFVPRAVFGRYLEQSALEALVRLQERGWRVRVVREGVKSATPAYRRIVLGTDGGRQFTVDRAVLCVGRGAPEDFYSLSGSPGFISDPYPLARSLDSIDPSDEVGVIGSGLTGVDVVVSLAARGHRGGIRMLSRSGVLPLVRQKASPYTLQHFTPERFRAAAAEGRVMTLDDLVDVMRAEFEAAGEDLGSVAEEIAAFQDGDPVTSLRRRPGRRGLAQPGAAHPPAGGPGHRSRCVAPAAREREEPSADHPLPHGDEPVLPDAMRPRPPRCWNWSTRDSWRSSPVSGTSRRPPTAGSSSTPLGAAPPTRRTPSSTR